VRAQSYQECLPPGCHTLDNEGDIQETARRFLRLIEEDASMHFDPQVEQ
jgi:ribose 1,5-bisphosphokinase PhnN